MAAALAGLAGAELSPETDYINRFIVEHHAALEPVLRAHYLSIGLPAYQLRDTIRDTVIWEAECSLDSIESYGDGYRRLLLERVIAGEGTTEARYALQDRLAIDLADSTRYAFQTLGTFARWFAHRGGVARHPIFEEREP